MEARARLMLSEMWRWLSSDVSDVTQVMPAPQAIVTGGEALEIRSGLERWATQLTRRRAAVVTRRYVLVALVIALVPGIVILATGGTRPFWLLVVLVLAPLAGAMALRQRTPASLTARVLDRSLGLHEQLGTALELQAEHVPATGLAAMVLSEAGVTLAQSFGSVRVRARRAPAEWGWLAAGLCGLAIVIAVPRHPATDGGSRGARAGVGAAGGPNGAQRGAAATRGHAMPASLRTTTRGLTVQQVPFTGGAKAAYGVQTSRSPGARAPITAQGSATVTGQHPKPGLAVFGGKGAGGTQRGARSQPGAGTSGTRTGASGSSAAGRAGAGNSTKAASSGTTHASSKQASDSTSRTSGASAGAQSRAGGARSGGEAAGIGHAAPNAKLGLQPYGGAGKTGKSGLPLQASYAPSGTGHVTARDGISQNNNNGGGGSGGRTGHAGSGTAAGRGSGTNFSVIPPAANTSSSSNQDLLQHYFGTTNQLQFKDW